MTTDPDSIRRRLIGGIAAGFATVALPAAAFAPATSRRPAPRRPAPAQSRDATDTAAAERLVQASALSGTVGFAVIDMASGQVLEQRLPTASLPPASVTKAATALYALEALGADHRFRTRLMTDGAIEGGTLRGDLYLVGGGDPTLDTDTLANLVQQLRQAGISAVDGRFLVVGSALPYVAAIDDAQPEYVGYNPAISGLNLNFNRVYFEWRRQGNGWAVSMDARSSAHRPAVSMAEMRIVNREAPIYSFRLENGRERWTVASRALGQDGGRWLPVRQPDLYAGETFRALAAARGLRMREPQRIAGIPRAARELAVVQSGRLAVILREMMRYSTNLTAEVVGLAASTRLGLSPSGPPQSAAAMASWVNGAIGQASARFVDHSGLGDASRITPVEMARFFAGVGWDSPLRELMRDHAVRDDQGRVMTDFRAAVAAKTGTLNFVSALGGYIAPPGGRRLAFSILTADLPRRNAIPPALRDRPDGARPWARQSRLLQSALIRRWASAYS